MLGLLIGGLATAFASWMVYRIQWNPLPLLGVVMASGALFYWGPKTYDYAKNAFLFPRMTVEQYCNQYFGGDPILRFPVWTCDKDEDYQLKGGASSNKQYFDTHTNALRPYFIPIDGSDRHFTFNHVHPASLPIWLKLVLLPDFCDINDGKRQLWRFSPPVVWPNVGSSCEKPDYFSHPNQVYSFQPLGHAPDIAVWERVYPRIKFLFHGKKFTFRYNARYGEVDMITWGPGADEGKFMGDFPVYARSSPAPVAPPVAEDLPNALPYKPIPFVHQPYPVGQLQKGYLYFGEQFLDAREPGHWIALDDLMHVIVMGTSGFGKSVFLNQILQGVRYNIDRFERVYLVDLKGGVELAEYEDYAEEFQLVDQIDALHEPIKQLVQTMKDRQAYMRANRLKKWPGKKIMLVIDEYSQIQLSPERTKEQKAAKGDLLDNLNSISMLGRSAGILIWAQLQKATSDVMDSSFRANLQFQICFKVPNKLTAASMFGTTDELLVDPVKLLKGRFIMYDADKGETHYLQARTQT